MVFTKSSHEATKYKEFCFDAHISYTNRGEKGLAHLNSLGISAAHLAWQHKAKETAVSGTEVLLIYLGGSTTVQWQKQQTSQKEKDVPCGSGQNTFVCLYETPFVESKNKPES